MQPRDRAGFRSCSALAALALAVLVDCSAAQTQTPPEAKPPWRVVILHNADFLLPASTIMDQALREALVRNSPRQIDLYGEVLDMLRYPGSTEAELVALLRKKHSGHRIDLVLARAQAGIEFALKHRGELWPDAQIVFYDNVGDVYKAGSRPFRDDVTGLLIDIDPRGTLELLQQLHPDARRLYVVGGVAASDLFWKRRVEALLAERNAAMEVIWLDNLPLPRLIEALARIPAESVVLFTSLMRDAGGRGRVNAQVAEMVARAANAPVYGFFDTLVGSGIVGGRIPDFAAQGRAAASLALRVLAGEPAGTIPIQPAPAARCVVDARALERWHIDQRTIPADCEVRFGSHAVWRDHPGFVAGAIALLLLQSALIAGLLLQRRELREAKLSDARQRADVERTLDFERLLVDISATLLRDRGSDPQTAIGEALRDIGQFLDVDRVILWSLNAGGDRYEPTHRWVAHGIDAPPAYIDRRMAPTLFSRVSHGEVVALSSLDDLPGAAIGEKGRLDRFGTRSLLAVPLVVEGLIVGALSLSSVRAERAWPGALVPRVRLIGEVFAGVLMRQHYVAKVREAQSETAEYRERLAHLVRVHTVGEMSAAIAHEVNQPLMAIENYALAARRRLEAGAVADGSKLRDLLDKIGAQAARAGDVLKRLRSIVKKHESEANRFDLGTLVADTLSLVEIETRLKDIRIDIIVAPDLPPVLADMVQIQQVVLNLALNGIEAMEASNVADKALRVEVRNGANDLLVVRVIDCGDGVDSVDGEHIFEPFYSTKDMGLGVGLAICRSIVEAHGGKLWYSRDNDRTVFQFTLPVADEKAEQ
jgi:signal transduction histidine kinase